MILQELSEASTFRKRSTSQMTYGFEFEVMVDNIKEDYDNVVQRLKNEYLLSSFIKEFIEDLNLRKDAPKYGFASKEDISKFNINENPEEAKLVQEILKLKDLKKQYFYLKMLKNFRNKIKIDNISDFDDYLKNKIPDETYKNERNNSFLKRIIKDYMYEYFPYFDDFITNKKSLNYIYNSNGKVINLLNIDTFDEIEELFEDSEVIINDIKEEYEYYIFDMADDIFENFDKVEYVKTLLGNYDIKNVNIELDESLGDDGVEIITDKIYGISEAISQFNKIIELIQNEDELYTNNSTGLHINIGTWQDISQIDLTKLLVFSNETKILSNMERQSNRYSSSLVKELVSFLDHKNKMKSKFKNYDKIIKDMNKELLLYSNHSSFMDFEKLKHKGYIEIRGFGNNDYEYKKDYIIKMLQYLSRVMEIASDPNEAKQQYIKKLYKIFDYETKLSGEEHKINNNSLLTQIEIDYITRFFKSDKIFYKNILQKPENNVLIILNKIISNLTKHDEKLTNSDLRILYKLLKNMDISKEYYEKNIKGKSEKIDNLFQNYILKGKV